MNRLRRQMNKRTYKVRADLYGRAWRGTNVPILSDWSRLGDLGKATRLVVLSDLTLDLLIVTATDSLLEARNEVPDLVDRRRVKREAKLLASALKAEDLVERTWVFLADATATYCCEHAPDPNARRRDEELLAALNHHFSLSDEDRQALDTGLKAVELGLYTPPVVFGRYALGLLIGDQEVADNLTLFDQDRFGMYMVVQVLDIWWRQAAAHYRELADHGRDPA